VVLRLRWIPPGRFKMGSPDNEAGRWEDEGPQHIVELTEGYWLCETACTQAEWETVMGRNPSNFQGDATRPVEQVSWDDCQEYCKRLNARFPGLRASLPTEAQWEYACRAGTESAYNEGSACTKPEGWDPALDILGWFDKNSENTTHPVKQKLPNTWGLYDMHGNVWEWCSDWHGSYSAEGQRDAMGAKDGSSRVDRGGGWDGSARICRSASRFRWHSSVRYDFLGFRIAAAQASQGRESGT
jgi:formylglycine-generating enzyme required for sulfatase activity